MTDTAPADNLFQAAGARGEIDPDAGFPTMTPLEFTRLRETIGTQREVAIELQTARKTIGRWERGDRAVPGVAAVAIQLLADVARARRERTKAAIMDAGIEGGEA